MQEIILENLFKWVQTLDFSFSRKGENYIFICEELNININAISQEEFYAAFTNQLLLGVEKLFNLKVLGINLKELFGLKKEEPKQKTEKQEKQEKPSAKQEINEDWIKEELEKAFRNGKLNKSKPIIDDYFRDYTQNFKDFPKFPWNQVICLVE